MEHRVPIQIIDNFLPKDKFKNLKNLFFNVSNTFPWFFCDYIAHEEDKSDFYFYHFLFKDGIITSPFFDKIVPILTNKKIYRAKCNLYTKKNKKIYTDYHIDLNYPHKVLLYSLNTNNGFTLFENGNKVFSKENRVVIFDGKIKHKSISQTDKKVRINININYEF